MAGTSAKGDLLQVHVFGNGSGESIIVGLPGGGWGVVDCFAPSLRDPADNVAAAWLHRRRVTELEFLCLTHPHRDHYRGMSRLMTEFGVKRFWRFGTSAPEDRRLALLSRARAMWSRSGDAIESADELLQILALARRRRQDPRWGLDSESRLVNLQPLLTVPATAERQACEVWGIAPSTASVASYEEALERAFSRGGRVIAGQSRLRHNMVSVALLVEYGASRVLLGGDVETLGWQRAVERVSPARLASSAVKVSHHGSSTGYCHGLWPAISVGARPVAVVTPFYEHELPQADALKHIASHSRRVISVCPLRRPRAALSARHRKARTALRAAIDVMDARPRRGGCCSLLLNDAGQCRYRLQGAAVGFTPARLGSD